MKRWYTVLLWWAITDLAIDGFLYLKADYEKFCRKWGEYEWWKRERELDDEEVQRDIAFRREAGFPGYSK